MTDPVTPDPETEEDVFEHMMANRPEPTAEVAAAMRELEAARTDLAGSLDELESLVERGDQLGRLSRSQQLHGMGIERHGGGHRARIEHVVAEVGAGVDPGHDHVRLPLEQGHCLRPGLRVEHAAADALERLPDDGEHGRLVLDHAGSGSRDKRRRQVQGVTQRRGLGGVQRFMAWPHAMLTDSGGYQVFSLARQRSAMT